MMVVMTTTLTLCSDLSIIRWWLLCYD